MTLHSNLILTYFTSSHSMVNDGYEFLLIGIVTHGTYIEKFPDVDYVIFIRLCLQKNYSEVQSFTYSS